MQESLKIIGLIISHFIWHSNFLIMFHTIITEVQEQPFFHNHNSFFPGPETLHNHFHKNICFAQGRESTHLSFLGQRHCTITFTSVFPGAETLLLCNQSLLGSIALSINLTIHQSFITLAFDQITLPEFEISTSKLLFLMPHHIRFFLYLPTSIDYPVYIQ
jgi:hypothetical protein